MLGVEKRVNMGEKGRYRTMNQSYCILGSGFITCRNSDCHGIVTIQKNLERFLSAPAVKKHSC
jgi:hypothetical protein